MADKPGRVIANLGRKLLIESETGEQFTAPVLRELPLLVAGDQVHWEQTKTGEPRVTGCLPRDSVLERTDRSGKPKPIAANVSQLLVVSAPRPEFDLMLIDQYSVAARHMGISLCIVINKCDLLSDQPDTNSDGARPSSGAIAGANDSAETAFAVTAQYVRSVYSKLGYPVLAVSAKSGTAIDQLSAQLQGRTSILVGQSGVGKSSLLNRILPETGAKTSRISETTGLGKHTTSVTHLFNLPSGGAIIDSPGVRQFSLEHLKGVDVEQGFIEIHEAALRCKFNDCLHVHEPGCQVKSDVETGHITQSRFDNFLLLRASSDLNTRS